MEDHSLAVLNLADGYTILGLIIQEDEHAFVIKDPMKIHFGSTSQKEMIGLERYDVITDESTTLIYKSSVVSINNNVAEPMVRYYEMKVKLYEALLDESLLDWLYESTEDLGRIFYPNGDINMGALKKILRLNVKSSSSLPLTSSNVEPTIH